MNKRSLESGFTLIEIVMVLVLLGILAAVAAPKYFDLQALAKVRAAQAAVAEAQSHINAKFAEKLLLGSNCVTARNAAADVVKTGLTLGDWTVQATFETVEASATSCQSDTKDATVTFTGKGKANSAGDTIIFGNDIAHSLVAPGCGIGSNS